MTSGRAGGGRKACGGAGSDAQSRAEAVRGVAVSILVDAQKPRGLGPS